MIQYKMLQHRNKIYARQVKKVNFLKSKMSFQSPN